MGEPLQVVVEGRGRAPTTCAYCREELGAAVFVHPWDMLGKKELEPYWMQWMVGMPAETTRAVVSLIFGGVLEKLPRLRIAFAHGGGSFPATIGRIEPAEAKTRDGKATVTLFGNGQSGTAKVTAFSGAAFANLDIPKDGFEISSRAAGIISRAYMRTKDPALLEVAAQARVRLGAPLGADPRGPDRLAVARRTGDLRHVEIPVDRLRERARDRGRGHVEDVRDTSVLAR